jgi:hypothetical protein
MSLLNIWKSSESLLSAKSVKQIIAIAGNGKLSDGNDTSIEFRGLLSKAPSDLLARYAEECLSEAFQDSGLVLQDTINETGRRLGFVVQDGRYRGRVGDIGNDGLWSLKDEWDIVVEVKTTDAYRIDLNAIARYREALCAQGSIAKARSSILIIVGRADTDDLEAQIRGSRHAWDIRLISIQSLIRLMRLKESVEDPDTLKRIHQLLVPKEFTKLDAIVDLLFVAAEDAKNAEEIIATENGQENAKEKFAPAAFNDLCVSRISKHLNLDLIKRTRVLFSAPDDSVKLICAVSKKYDDSRNGNYWFAFHPHQKKELDSQSRNFISFGCGSPAMTLLIPGQDFLNWVDGMGTTEGEDRMYWHVQIFDQEEGIFLVRKKGAERINLSKYLLPSE